MCAARAAPSGSIRGARGGGSGQSPRASPRAFSVGVRARPRLHAVALARAGFEPPTVDDAYEAAAVAYVAARAQRRGEFRYPRASRAEVARDALVREREPLVARAVVNH